jgi:hypothetical protein
MHWIQVRVLSDIIGFIQDKTNDEPDLMECKETDDGKLTVCLAFTIRRDYPGMKPEEEAKTQ